MAGTEKHLRSLPRDLVAFYKYSWEENQHIFLFQAICDIRNRAWNRLRLSGDGDDGIWEAMRNECSTIGSRVSEVLSSTNNVTSKERGKAWDQWIRDGWAAGASLAHKLSKLPEQWMPDVDKKDDPFSHDVIGRLEMERVKYTELWDGSTKERDHEPYHCKKTDRMPDITPSDLLNAAETFTHTTSCTYDGIHPRHVALLSHEGRQALANILMACEAMGVWPDSVRVTICRES